MRCFAGIPLPGILDSQSIQKSIVLTHEQASNWRWVRKENQHLTLSFLGDINTQQVIDISEALSAVRWEAFPLTLNVPQCSLFPVHGKQHYYVAHVELSQALKEVHQQLSSVLIKLGIRQEKRAYLPHITLARLKQPHRGSVQPDTIRLNQTIRCEQFGLFQSILSDQGPSYQALAYYPAQGK